MNNQYDAGYNAFVTEGKQSDEFVKQQPYLWRSGYNRAVLDDQQKNASPLLSTTLYPVNYNKHVYKPTYNDIMGATRQPRLRKLHDVRELLPVLHSVVSSVEKRADTITSYSQVVSLVNDAFDLVLQYGYDEGVLNSVDLAKYNYEPKKKV